GFGKGPGGGPPEGVPVQEPEPAGAPRRGPAHGPQERCERDPSESGPIEGRKGESVADRAEKGCCYAHGAVTRSYRSVLVGAGVDVTISRNGGVAPGMGARPLARTPLIATIMW